MAKDGTARGGARPGTGPKRKALAEKISAGKPATIIGLPDTSALEGMDPPVKEYMKAKQKNGTDLCAEKVFEETWEWLKKVGCADYVNTQLYRSISMRFSKRKGQVSRCSLPVPLVQN